MTDGLDHPDLAGVGADMRAEWRDEQEAATEDAAAQWRHSRTLADWLTQRTHAGDRIAISVGAQRFAGLVEEVSDDLIGLRARVGRDAPLLIAAAAPRRAKRGFGASLSGLLNRCQS